MDKIVVDIPNEKRLADYLIGRFLETGTRSAAKKIVKAGRIKLNGVVATTANIPKLYDEIELMPSFDNPPKPYTLKVEVLNEDDHFAVVLKPAGLTTSGNLFKTLENTLTTSLEKSQSEDRLPWPRVAHRLDAPTSGLVLIAKTYSALRFFKDGFANGSIKKKYHAVIQGELNLDEKIITDPIEDRNAHSILRTVKKVESLKSGCLSLVELEPITGRTHQLRIHCAKNGTPILGDRLYGDPKNNLLGKGLFLSSTEITFTHPETNESITAHVDIPSKFKSLLEREERRWRKFN